MAYVDPATETAMTARQCLSVFFPAYAAFSAQHHRLLCSAAVPAARRALHLGNSTACKAAAPNVLCFTLQLLQVQYNGYSSYPYCGLIGFDRIIPWMLLLSHLLKTAEVTEQILSL